MTSIFPFPYISYVITLGWLFLWSIWKLLSLHDQITLKRGTCIKLNFIIVDLSNEIVILNFGNNLFSIETAMPFQFYVMRKNRRNNSYCCTCNCLRSLDFSFWYYFFIKICTFDFRRNIVFITIFRLNRRLY